MGHSTNNKNLPEAPPENYERVKKPKAGFRCKWLMPDGTFCAHPTIYGSPYTLFTSHLNRTHRHHIPAHIHGRRRKNLPKTASHKIRAKTKAGNRLSDAFLSEGSVSSHSEPTLQEPLPLAGITMLT